MLHSHQQSMCIVMEICIFDADAPCETETVHLPIILATIHFLLVVNL